MAAAWLFAMILACVEAPFVSSGGGMSSSGSSSWLRPVALAVAVIAVTATTWLVRRQAKGLPTVARLFIHPIKSCAPIEVQSLHIDNLGIANDRRWAVMDMSKEPSSRVLSLRSHPRLALITPSLMDPEADPRNSDGSRVPTLTLRAPGMPELQVPGPSARAAPLNVNLHEVMGVALDCGDDASKWLNKFFGEGSSFRLAYLSDGHSGGLNATRARDMCKQVKWNGGGEAGSVYMQGTKVGFADSTHLTLVSEGSLRDVSRRLSAGGNMSPERFRMNVVLAGTHAYEEELWKSFVLGGAVYEVSKLCDRCMLTLVDPTTGERGPLKGEPLRLLRSYRSGEQLWSVDPRHGTAPILGTKACTNASEGIVRIGDVISSVVLRGRGDRMY